MLVWSRVAKAKIPACVLKTACSVMLPAAPEHCHPARLGLEFLRKALGVLGGSEVRILGLGL